MEGIYPIVIRGKNCGSLKVSREGAYTRFEADCDEQGEVIRLAVYGGGKEGYLGVPMPKEGRLHLDKRLSPASMRSFPDLIEDCSLAGEKRKESVPVTSQAESMATVEEIRELTHEEKEEAEESSTFWYATTDGALVSRDGDREMVALPPDDERVPKNFPGQPRIIEGKEYLVYITKEM